MVSTISSFDDLVFVLDERNFIIQYYIPKNEKIFFEIKKELKGLHFCRLGYPKSIIEKFSNAIEKTKKIDTIQALLIHI